MQLIQLIQEIVKTRRVTPTQEREIDALLWSKEFNEAEMEALKRLEELLAEGQVLVG
jgi:hypothetical protein